MPYRHAHWFVLGLFPLVGLAFWPGYLSIIAKAPPQLHAHGITATCWLVLLVAQSWTIHHGQRPLHRTLGLAGLVIFPLFLAAGAGIFVGMAQRYVAHLSPFYVVYAPRLAGIDAVAVPGFAWFFFQAMRRRRNVGLHAGYLLATTIFLLPPILGRLAPGLPPLTPHGPADFWKLGAGFQLANAIAAGFALAVGLKAGKAGSPFLQAAAITVLGAVLFQFVGPTPWWGAAYAQVAALPEMPMDLAAGLIGAGIAWAGWQAGKAPN